MLLKDTKWHLISYVAEIRWINRSNSYMTFIKYKICRNNLVISVILPQYCCSGKISNNKNITMNTKNPFQVGDWSEFVKRKLL